MTQTEGSTNVTALTVDAIRRRLEFVPVDGIEIAVHEVASLIRGDMTLRPDQAAELIAAARSYLPIPSEAWIDGKIQKAKYRYLMQTAGAIINVLRKNQRLTEERRLALLAYLEQKLTQILGRDATGAFMHKQCEAPPESATRRRRADESEQDERPPVRWDDPGKQEATA